MKIHFCDLCNESVPQADLDSGRAIQRKGRIVCAHCDAVMSHPAPTSGVLAAVAARASQNEAVAPSLAAPGATPSAATANGAAPTANGRADSAGATPDSEPARWGASSTDANPPFGSQPAAAIPTAPAAPTPIVVRAGGSGALWVALLGLVFTAAAVWVLDDRLRTSDQRQVQLRRDVDARDGDVQMLQRRASLTDEALRDLDRKYNGRVEAQKERADALAAELTRVRTERDELVKRLAALETFAAGATERAGAGAIELEKRLAEFSRAIAKGEDDARALEQRLLELELTPRAPAAPVATPIPEPAAAPWLARVDDLKNASSSLRWEAVTQIGDAKDPASVPYLVPLLKDEDVIVRMAVARVLGEMQAKAAVPDLINALEDSESAMREYTYVALRQITGKDLKFEYDASEAERAKRVKAWREWWKKESETPQGS